MSVPSDWLEINQSIGQPGTPASPAMNEHTPQRVTCVLAVFSSLLNKPIVNQELEEYAYGYLSRQCPPGHQPGAIRWTEQLPLNTARARRSPDLASFPFDLANWAADKDAFYLRVYETHTVTKGATQ